jgi:uncharacterized membrane protein YccC
MTTRSPSTLSADVVSLHGLDDWKRLSRLAAPTDIEALRARSEQVRQSMLENLERIEALLEDFQSSAHEADAARLADVMRVKFKLAHVRHLTDRLTDIATRVSRLQSPDQETAAKAMPSISAAPPQDSDA